MTDEKIAEILEYEAKATPGPWRAAFPTGRDTQWLDIVVGPNDVEILHAETEPLPEVVWPTHKDSVATRIEQHKGNLEFCARARTDLPEAMREIQRLRAEVVELRKDKERLDWLNLKGIYIDMDEVSKQLQYTVCNASAGDLASGFSIRAAIDAAKEAAK